MLKKFLKFILQHKFIAAIIIIALLGGGYWGYGKFIKGDATETRYVLATVEKGTLITSVSGSGQVSVSNQVDIKSKVSGDALNVAVQNGQEVKTGDILVQLNAQDAYKTVRDAAANLESSKLSLEKLKQPASDYSIMQAENSLENARTSLEKLKLSQQTDYQKTQEAKQNAEDDLQKSYEDGFNTVANAFLDLPTAMAGLQSILYSTDYGNNQWNADYYVKIAQGYNEKIVQFRDDAVTKYQEARREYDQNFSDYKSANRSSSPAAIEALIDETHETTRSIAEAVKSVNNFIQFYEDKLTERNLKPQTLADTQLSNLGSYTNKTNSHLANLLSTKNTIQTDKETITNAERDLKEMDQNNPLDLAAAEATVKEKEVSLANLKAGADPLDIKSQELSIKQKENSLLDAREKLADYTIRASFDGIMVDVSIKKGDSVSSGTAIATLITKQQIAEISLNEVDVAKVKVGQKVTLSFDAIEGLSITGEVAEIDALGTVSQGVVTYNVKIVFDTQDERVKPGMSVSASIITDIKQDVLLVANSAIKSSDNTHYVEMLENVPASNQSTISTSSSEGITSATPPSQQVIEVGLSNDTMTEVVSGLKEGEQIVVRTVNSSTTQTQSSQGQSLFQLGGSRSGGGNLRSTGGGIPRD